MWKRWWPVLGGLAVFAACCLPMGQGGQAEASNAAEPGSYAAGNQAEVAADAQAGNSESSLKSAEHWLEEREQAAGKYEERGNNEAQELQFVQIISNENGFAYFVDMKNARWIHRPYSASEYIADIWVKLIPVEYKIYANRNSSSIGWNTNDYEQPTYFMEHYYLRPDKQQIQFLCELEVTGRPQNAIKERAYDYKHWENLIPGSIEDEIYHRVLVLMKDKPRYGESQTFWDALDEYLRISL